VCAAAEVKKPLSGTAINIGSGVNYSISNIADLIGGVAYPRTLLPPRAGDVRAVRADISHARTLLGWSPAVSFPTGIEILKGLIKNGV